MDSLRSAAPKAETQERTPWLSQRLPRLWAKPQKMDEHDPFKTMVRRYDRAVVRKGGTSIFATRFERGID